MSRRYTKLAIAVLIVTGLIGLVLLRRSTVPSEPASAPTPTVDTPSQNIADDDPPSRPAGPLDPDAQLRPDLMSVEGVAAPAETIEVHYATPTMRGSNYVLEHLTESGIWAAQYLLTSDFGGDAVPAWSPIDPVDSAIFGGEQATISHLKSDRLLLPDSLNAGMYRVCTVGLKENFCARFEVA